MGSRVEGVEVGGGWVGSRVEGGGEMGGWGQG